MESGCPDLDKLPLKWSSSIYVATSDEMSYNEAVKTLRLSKYDGVIMPPPQNKSIVNEITKSKMMEIADAIIFWIPENSNRDLFGYYGYWAKSGKAYVGFPSAEQHHVGHQVAEENGLSFFSNVSDVCAHVAKKLLAEAKGTRSGAERFVPLTLWNSPDFQCWYKSQKKVGNRLDGCKYEWTFRHGANKKQRRMWVLHLDVYVAEEERNKSNEICFFLPANHVRVLAYKPGSSYQTTKLVLVRKFHPCASNGNDMYRVGLPGGPPKSPTHESDPVLAAQDFFYQATGFLLAPSRFSLQEERQTGVISPCHSHVYAVQLTAAELTSIEDKPSSKLKNATVQVMTVQRLLESKDSTYSNLGMVLTTLYKLMPVPDSPKVFLKNITVFALIPFACYVASILYDRFV